MQHSPESLWRLPRRSPIWTQVQLTRGIMYISSVKNPFAQSQKLYTFSQFLWLLTLIHWGCKEHPFFIQEAKWQAIFDFTIKKKITTKSKETANSQVTWSLKFFFDHYFVSGETSSKQVLGTLEQLKKHTVLTLVTHIGQKAKLPKCLSQVNSRYIV